MSNRDGALVFELQPDDDGAGHTIHAGAGAGADDGNSPDTLVEPDPPAAVDVSVYADPFGAAREFVARQPRRRIVGALVSAGLVIALAVGGSIAFRAIRAATAERERLTALAASPGGVPDVTGGPLQEAWSVPVQGWMLGTLPGLVVVQDGADVAALRASDGGEAWRVSLGENLDCGGLRWPTERAPEPARMTCVSGPEGDRHVTVLGEAGVSGQRDLGDLGDTTGETIGRQVFAGPGDSVITIRRTGEAPPKSPVVEFGVDLGVAFPDGVTAGQGAVVSMQDAVTGEQRWTDEIAFAPVSDVSRCGVDLVDENSLRLDFGATVQASATLITVMGCGVDAAYLPDGTRLAGDVDPALLPATYQPDPDGGFVETRLDGTVALRDERGHERYTLASPLTLPSTTDSKSDERLGLDTSGRLTALAADGTVLWTADGALNVAEVVGRVGGIVVGVSRSGETLVGINEADGSTAWTTPIPDADGAYEAGFGGAVNDGVTIVFQIYDSDGDGSWNSVIGGVDVRSGKVWTIHREVGSFGSVFAVDDAVIEIEYSADVVDTYRRAAEGTGARPSGTIRRLVPPTEKHR